MNTKDMKICVIGGDGRQTYLAKGFEKDGFEVSAFCVPDIPDKTPLSEALSGASAVVLPFPVSPDCFCLNCRCGETIRLSELFALIKKKGINKVFAGAVPACVSEKADEYGLKIVDYGKNESVAIKNAYITAESAVGIAIKETPFTLLASNSTVFGYGRIGKQLCRLLKAFKSEVRCAARKAEDIALMETEGIIPVRYSEAAAAAKESDIVFNTVPARVIDDGILREMKKETLIIDLASAPGGVERESAERRGIRVISALSLPGKTAPETSAGVIRKAVFDEFAK